MKKGKLITYFRLLSGMNLSKIENKEVRSAIISNHLMMYRLVQQHDEDIKELQKKLFEGKDEEIMALNKLREEYRDTADEAKKKEIVDKIMADHQPILQLEGELNGLLKEKLEEDVDITIKKVAQEDFVEACVKAEVDITPADLIVLDDLIETNN